MGNEIESHMTLEFQDGSASDIKGEYQTLEETVAAFKVACAVLDAIGNREFRIKLSVTRHTTV